MRIGHRRLSWLLVVQAISLPEDAIGISLNARIGFSLFEALQVPIQERPECLVVGRLHGGWRNG